MSSHPLTPRRVRLSWILAALGASAVGLIGAVFLADAPVVGMPSLLLGGSGALLVVTLFSVRLEQVRQAEKYGTDSGDES